jgi:hypothetical protein
MGIERGIECTVCGKMIPGTVNSMKYHVKSRHSGKQAD